MGQQRALEEAIQLTSADTGAERIVDLLDGRQERAHSAAGLGRQRNDRRPRREAQLVASLLFEPLLRSGVEEVDLVDADDDRSPAVDREPENLGILLGDA